MVEQVNAMSVGETIDGICDKLLYHLVTSIGNKQIKSKSSLSTQRYLVRDRVHAPTVGPFARLDLI